jgi:two-component system response regulator VicR
LIVDDDASTVRLLSILLRSEHIEVEQAYDGEEGLNALEETHPDLVILDMQMPHVDGRTFYEQARRSGYDGPVMVCCASGARAAQREIGADAAVEKPFDPDDLISSVKELLPDESASSHP